MTKQTKVLASIVGILVVTAIVLFSTNSEMFQGRAGRDVGSRAPRDSRSSYVDPNAVSIVSVTVDGVYQPVYIGGNSVANSDPMFLLWVKGKNLKNIKSISFDDSTLKNLNVFEYFDDNGSPTDVVFAKDTVSGIKKVTYTDVNGTTQTFSFELKLPIQTQAPIITYPTTNGTLSLSSPTITWKNTKAAEQYAYYPSYNNPFLHSYFYDLEITDNDGVASYASSLNLYPEDSCSKDIYLTPSFDVENNYYGKHWTCKSFKIPDDILQKLVIGEKYNLKVVSYDMRNYGNGKNVMERVESGVVFTVVK